MKIEKSEDTEGISEEIEEEQTGVSPSLYPYPICHSRTPFSLDETDTNVSESTVERSEQSDTSEENTESNECKNGGKSTDEACKGSKKERKLTKTSTTAKSEKSRKGHDSSKSCSSSKSSEDEESESSKNDFSAKGSDFDDESTNSVFIRSDSEAESDENDDGFDSDTVFINDDISSEDEYKSIFCYSDSEADRMLLRLIHDVYVFKLNLL